MPLQDLRFLHANVMPLCDSHVNKHFDGYHTLQYSISGGVEVFYNNDRYLLEEGGWFWTAYPGPLIRFHTAPGYATWHHRYAAFSGTRVARWIADGLWFERPQKITDLTGYAHRFDDLLNHIHHSTDRFRLARAVNLLEAFLLELAEERARATATPERELWLSTLLQHIADHEHEPDVETFARENGMALGTLRRRFKAAIGVPLHEFIVQNRLARARTLLGETDLPIKAIAERLGYRDVYFFTRQFKQGIGVPPATFRRSRQI